MLDEYQKEQQVAYRFLKNAFLSGKNSHAYLLETRGYSKQMDLAISFAKFILCPFHYTNSKKCGNCMQCQSIDDHNFTELKVISPDGNQIKKEQLADLQKDFSTKAVNSNMRVYIINHAESMNEYAANSLLKFLEEPAPNIVAILLADNQYQILDTIVSRCQVVSLINSHSKDNQDTISKIASLLFDNEESCKTYIGAPESKENIEHVIAFIKYYEIHHLDTLLHTTNLWHDYFNDNETIKQALSIMLIFYKDVLNVLLNKNIEVMNDYQNDIMDVAGLNKIDNITRKIGILISIQNKMQYNINKNLMIDNLIFEFEGDINE